MSAPGVGGVLEPGGDATARVALIANSWLEGDEWGPFHRSLIEIFRAVAAELLVVRANSFFYPWSHAPLSPAHETGLKRALDEFEPTIVFSVNRAALSPGVTESLPASARIITLFIDFYNRVPDALKTFTERDFVWGTGIGRLRDEFVRQYGHVLSEDQIEFTLWASDTSTYYPRGLERDIGVLFVGSPLQQRDFADLVDAIRADERNLEIFLDTYFEHRGGYVYNIVDELRGQGFDFDAVVDEPYREYLRHNWILQSFMSDQISSEIRVRYLSALSAFDLHLYGEPEKSWIEALAAADGRLLRRYRFRPVKDPAELPRLYNRAKIGLNVQHHHAADVGLSMRVFDILACESLLLTHAITNRPLAELGLVEGADYLAFRSPEDLREQATAMLRDDALRDQIARSGSAKLHAEHTLTKRLGHVFRRAGYERLGERIAQLSRRDVQTASLPVRYLSAPTEDVGAPTSVREPKRRKYEYEKQPFPRTPRQLRAAIGRALPDDLFDLDLRVFRNWFLGLSLRRRHDCGDR